MKSYLHPNSVISFNDKDVNLCIDYLNNTSSKNKLYWFDSCSLKNNKLYFNDKLIIPNSKINDELMTIYKNPLLSGGRDIIYNYCKDNYVGIS